jgi:hypothetical protein
MGPKAMDLKTGHDRLIGHALARMQHDDLTMSCLGLDFLALVCGVPPLTISGVKPFHVPFVVGYGH